MFLILSTLAERLEKKPWVGFSGSRILLKPCYLYIALYRNPLGVLSNSDFESAGLGWDLRLCTSNQLPRAAGTMCCEASGK